MTSTTFFLVFIPILAILLLVINLLLSPHNPYQEKDSAFECGFSSFLGQNRTQFNISFFIFALLFLLFDLEILLVYPYVVSAYQNDLYGLVLLLLFFIILTLGFAFELGKNALKLESRQNSTNLSKYPVQSYFILTNPTNLKFLTNKESNFNLTQRRNFSSSARKKIDEPNSSNLELLEDLGMKPAVVYTNASADKEIILADNKKKSGVYMWKNNSNGKLYVGSSYDLSRRLSRYYQTLFLQTQLKRGRSAIYSALLKYTHAEFSLYILEYCAPERLLEIEQKYINILKPVYNLLIIAGSRRGTIVSDETRALISKARTGIVQSLEARKKIGIAQGTAVTVLDTLTGKSTIYVSNAEAARALNTYSKKIWRLADTGKLLDDRYLISKVKQ